MEFAGGKQGVNHGGPLGCFVASGEQVIFSAYRHRAQGVLHGIVIDMQPGIGGIPYKTCFLLEFEQKKNSNNYLYYQLCGF